MSDGARRFNYNGAGRLTSATRAGVTTSYMYNALGQRIQKANATGSTLFAYDEQGHLIGEYDQNGLVQELVWLDDIPVATLRTDQGGTNTGLFYIHTDHLNAPTKVTRTTNNEVIWRWDHDPYGNGIPNEDPDGNGLTLAMNLRYPGQYLDSETGLYYNNFRYYDPGTGRYIESDSIGLAGGSLSTYSYVDNDPVLYVDPTGLVKVDLFGDKDEIFKKIIAEYKDDPNKCLLYAHGNASGVLNGKTGKMMGSKELTKALVDAGCTEDMPVVMYSCRTAEGKNSIAEQVSKNFSSVTAPTKQIWYNQPKVWYNPFYRANGPDMIYGKNPDGTRNTNDPGQMRTYP